MNLKKLVAPAIIASVAFGTYTSASAGGQNRGATQAPPKVAMCHVTGNGNARLLEISVHAARGHTRHGDAVPGGQVSGDAGLVYDEDCNPVSKGLAAGCFDGAFFFDLDYNGDSSSADNSVFHTSFDGSCGGESSSPVTLVEAADSATAAAACEVLGARGDYVVTFNSFGFDTLPETAWYCR